MTSACQSSTNTNSDSISIASTKCSNTQDANHASEPSIQQRSRASQTFFGVISDRIRSRSHSRSPTPTPTTERPVVDPQRIRQQHNMSATYTFEKPKRSNTADSQETMVSRGSYVAASSSNNSSKRQSTDRSDFERLTYGRHSGDWLFNGFSVTQTVKKAVKKAKNSSK